MELHLVPDSLVTDPSPIRVRDLRGGWYFCPRPLSVPPPCVLVRDGIPKIYLIHNYDTFTLLPQLHSPFELSPITSKCPRPIATVPDHKVVRCVNVLRQFTLPHRDMFLDTLARSLFRFTSEHKGLAVKMSFHSLRP